MIKQTYIYLIMLILISFIFLSGCDNTSDQNVYWDFDEQRAFKDVEYQLELGPRIPGTESHEKAIEWMISELESTGWKTEIHNKPLASN
jgi:hypothetical protein